MTDLKILDERIRTLQTKLSRMQTRRQRIEAHEEKNAVKARQQTELQRRALAGELLLQAVDRGEVPRSLVSNWCDTLDLKRSERDLLGV
jgi:hypothetical protein